MRFAILKMPLCSFSLNIFLQKYRLAYFTKYVLKQISENQISPPIIMGRRMTPPMGMSPPIFYAI
jgi:hypothetical protein